MISLEKWTALTPLQKLPNNVGKLGKLICAKCFEWLPKVQKIAQPGHTVLYKNQIEQTWSCGASAASSGTRWKVNCLYLAICRFKNWPSGIK